jgi:hypothetical protein
MRPASTDSASKNFERTAAWALLPLMSAVCFSLAGGVLFGIFGDWLKPQIGFVPLWWHGAIAGLCIGMFVGIVQGRRSIKRSEQMEEVSLSLGLQPLARDDVKKLQQWLHRVLSRKISLQDSYFRSDDGADMVVGELTIRARSSPSSNSNPPDRVQTCVYLKTENISFPEFSLRPEGVLSNIIASEADIDFDDSSEFSKRYFLTARAEVDARKLFTPGVRNYFEKHPGLQIFGTGNEMVIYRPKHLCQPDEIQSFVSTSLGCLRALSESSATPEPQPEKQ